MIKNQTVYRSDLYIRISELLARHGLFGTDLGKMLGLKKSPLTDWKNGKSQPTMEQIKKICTYFSVSSDYLLFGEIPSAPLSAAVLAEPQAAYGHIAQPASSRQRAAEPALSAETHLSGGEFASDEQELLENYRKLDNKSRHKLQLYIYELLG